MTGRVRLSLAHATMLDVSPAELIRVAAATGYEAVGLRLIPMGRPGEPRHGLDEHPDYPRAIRQALTETGVRLLDVEVALVKQGVDPRAYLPAFEGAAALGARFVLTNVYTPDRAAAQDGFESLCEVAAPFGLTIALEPVSFSDVSTSQQAIEIVRVSGHDNAAVLIDTLHFHSAREPLSGLADLTPDRVHYVHVCDGPREIPSAGDDLRRIAREERLLPGEGGIDVAGILERLPAGIIYAIEAQNPARSAALGAEAYARLAFETTSRYLSAHGLQDVS